MNARFSDYLKSTPFYFLPHHFISRILFYVARVRWTPFKNFSIRTYMAIKTVKMSEAEEENPLNYATLNAFFTRALKTRVRPRAEGEKTLLCPVDGTVSQAQKIEDGRIFQAKGHDYSLLELVGGIKKLAKPFQNGYFSTLYLSPCDYHRIHMPLSGTLTDMVYVPGRLFSVAPHTVKTVARLFARNERVVCAFETDMGPMIMVLVGAVNVSAIDTVWAGAITPPSKGKIKHTQYAKGEVSLEKGAEMGRFNLGSTVVMLLPENVQLDDSIVHDNTVRLYQALGSYKL